MKGGPKEDLLLIALIQLGLGFRVRIGKPRYFTGKKIILLSALPSTGHQYSFLNELCQVIYEYFKILCKIKMLFSVMQHSKKCSAINNLPKLCMKNRPARWWGKIWGISSPSFQGGERWWKFLSRLKQIKAFFRILSFIFFHALACDSSSFPEFFAYYFSSRSLILVTHPQ